MISIITPALVKDENTYQWLHECIASVDGQPGDWEHIVVNDHSPVNLDALKEAWPKVRWLEAEGQGVSMARNQAVESARGDLILPLDADDKLAPDALATFSRAWEQRGDAGIIYSDVVMFGQDYARVYLAPVYDFRTLLQATFMVVGCLHKKASWEKVGGWRIDMTKGLEDWEYWIALGEAGVCGKRVPEPLYWYRRHPRGRLQWLKSNQELWDNAYLAMRELHRDSYDGRYPMGCCGGRAKAARPLHGGVPRAPMRATPIPPASGLVKLAYYGPRRGDFRVAGGVTRTLYRVPGPGEIVQLAENGRQGVLPADVAWFRSVGGGTHFRVIEQPATPPPATPLRPRVPVPPPGPVADTATWTPEIMESADVRASDEEPAAEAEAAPEAEPTPEPEGVEEPGGDTRKTRRTRKR